MKQTAPPGSGPLMSGVLQSQSSWQMSLGERAALIGILQQVRPRLSIEIGTAEGGSLRQIARHSAEVHAMDLVTPDPAVVDDHVKVHTGDSHILLPPLLQTLAAGSRNVDFVLVDGDHYADGVAQDVTDLLDSPALARTVILLHDSFNPEVRRGLEAVDYDERPAIVHVDLDWVPGRVFSGRLAGQLWGGLGLIVVDARHPRGVSATSARHDQHRSSLEELLAARAVIDAGGRATDAPAAAPADLPEAPWPQRAARRLRRWRAPS